ncbi:BON domain-containing protein [Citrifermentans bremense]|uniref:BON domain-containing protein n=1 Tax=Citrifermentans bremense TaxID=60035 RepID=UPI000423A6DD|nr:BON domain-containing protein [Citrifermentans bremense]
MKKVNLLIAIALSAAVVFNAPPQATAAQDSSAAKADNSKKNKEASKGVTADQQKENKPDRETTRQIRRAVVKDKSLSIKAHNVKIITTNGKVTLKGPVKSESEKTTIEKIAEGIVGKGNITNEIEVAPPSDKGKDKEKSKSDKEKGK